ncbi:MAG: hypothetical protein GXP31_00165 [Kiritimatiellaeota bacterium]|nr:hypothetical protein [Kiritimatiellota bacterium]
MMPNRFSTISIRVRGQAAVAFLIAFGVLGLTAVAAAPVCISTNTAGVAGDGDSGTVKILGQITPASAPVAEGKVFFVSSATNLGTTPEPDGDYSQLFAKDIALGTVQLLTQPAAPAQAGAETGDGNTVAVAVSSDGAVWCVLSEAMNLMAPTFDTNPGNDVFLWFPGATGTEILCASGPTGFPLADGDAFGPPAMNSGGSALVFASRASNLVDSDTNGAADIFLFDRTTALASLLSLSSEEVQGDGDSLTPSISSDSRFVAFASDASNLVAGDSNGVRDVFLRDRTDGTTIRVNHTDTGNPTAWPADSPRISADGRFIAYVSEDPDIVPNDNNGVADVFVWDGTTGATERVSIDSAGAGADAPCSRPWISGDGRFVVFLSAASNLDPTLRARAGAQQVFLHDRDTGRTQLVSVNNTGTPADADCFAPFISNDGRYITFSSKATVFQGADGTHYQVFLFDRGEHPGNHPPTADPLAVTAAPGAQVQITLTGIDQDGDTVSFQFLQLPVHGALTLPDRSPVTLTTMISEQEMPLTYSAPADWIGDDTFSFAAFDPYGGRSDATSGVVRVSSFDRPVLSLLSVAPDGQTPGSDDTPAYPFPTRIAIAADSTIAFGSRAANLVTDDTNNRKDVFLREYWSQQTTLVSALPGGPPADANSFAPAIAPDGGTVAFVSAGDTPFSLDLFLFDRLTGRVERLPLDDPQNDDVPWAALSQHGDVLVFSTESPLTTDDTNAFADVYRYVSGQREFQRLSAPAGGGTPDGPSTRPAIDWPGNTVAFVSRADNLVPDAGANNAADIFVYLAESATLVRASPAGTDADSTSPSLSMNGRFLAFESVATNITQTPPAAGHSQVYVIDLVSGTEEMVSTNAAGEAANADCHSPRITAGGRYVCFLSAATNLVSPELAPGTPTQVWVKDRKTGEVLLCTQAQVQPDDPAANGPATNCAISPDGRLVTFSSAASNLLDAADGSQSQLFAADLGPRPNSLPVATDGTVETQEDVTVAAIPLGGSDGDGDDLLFEIVTPPTRGVLGNILPPRFDRATSTVSYTPAENRYGTDTFTVRCRDADGWSEAATITVRIAEVNDFPEFAPVADQEVNETQTLTVPLAFTDADTENQPPTDVWTFRVTSGPGQIVEQRDGFAYRYTPDHTVATPVNPDVQQSVTVEIDDGRGGTAARTFTVTVHDVNAPPQASALAVLPEAPITTIANLTASFQYSDIDGDPENGSTVVWFFRSNGGAGQFQTYTGPLVDTGGPVLSVPATATTKHQQWYFTVTPKDARGLTGNTVESPQVEIANSAPAITVTDTAFDALEDTPFDISVTASDADADEPLALVITQPNHGTLAESAGTDRSGTNYTFHLRYTLEPDYSSPPGQPDHFTLAVSDGESTSPVQTMTVTVQPVDDAPVLTRLGDIEIGPGQESGTLGIAPAQGARIQVADVDNDIASEVVIRLAAIPGKGIVTDSAGETVNPGEDLALARFPLTYTAHRDAADVDEIQLTASDGEKTSSEIAVRVFLGTLTTTLTLSPGWNLIALPMQPTLSAPADLFSDPVARTPVFSGNVWRWDAVRGVYRVATAIEAGQGYWLYCPAAVPVLELRGVRLSSAVIETGKGWNLVGPAGYGQTGIATVIAPPQRQAPVLWRWDAELQGFVPVQGGGLLRNSGYWLFSRISGTVDLDLPWSETVH